MSVLQRRELEESPLADLHAIASELGLEGYRTLRREDLIAAILGEGGREPESAEPEEAEPEAPEALAEEPEAAAEEPEAAAEPSAISEPEPPEAPEPVEPPPASQERAEAENVQGVLDVLPNGSGFLRIEGGPGDVYVSPAQIRRCELRAGDEVTGPLRPARRNERHASLVRVELVNGRAAEPPEERPHFDDLTPVHPTERLPVPDAVSSIPIGKGSRVAIAGSPGAGATRILREVVSTLAADGGFAVSVVLVGARPEEVTDWRREAGVPVSGGSFDRSTEIQAQAAELAVESAKRTVERGGDAVVVIDSLESLPGGAARRLFGAARKVEEGGSLTVIAATGMAWDPQRQASTRIALDAPGEDGLPQVSASRSGTLRADLLG